MHPPSRPARASRIVAVASAVAFGLAGLAVGASAPAARAAGPRTIILTLIRHGESAGNASGLIDTSTPGPELTLKGWCQAQVTADQLRPNRYDGVFASPMVRTQETATPLAQALAEQVTVLPGLREIEAGSYEGSPESDAVHSIFAAPEQWLRGNRSARIPGSIDGNEFNSRFSSAVQQIFDSGENNPVAFSHGAAIMLWTLMNVHHPNPALILTQPLPNVGRVVLTGNPTVGWTLAEWDADPAPC